VEPATVQVQNVEGTLDTVGPDSVVVRSGKEKALTYRYPQASRYVDESGNVVRRELLVPGLPVTVQYVRDGDSLVAKNVIVHQKVATATTSGPTGTATTTTTTTTTTEKVKNTVAEGVLGLWEPDRFELNTEKHGTVRFLYSKDTKLMDADSKHVDAIRMKPGLPVTVRFRQEGDHLMADQVTLNARTVEVTR
jgi:hypothetical protein